MTAISDEIQNGFAQCSQGELSKPTTFKMMVDLTLEIILRKSSKTTTTSTIDSFATKHQQIDKIAIKQGHSSLVSLFLAASREDSDSETVGNVLEEQRVSKELCEIASQKFAENRDQIRAAVLSAISGTRRERIVDVDWRLDYFVKCNSIDHVSIPVFFVRFHTMNPSGLNGTIEFTCSIEELQELVNKLRDASKQTDRSSLLFS